MGSPIFPFPVLNFLQPLGIDFVDREWKGSTNAKSLRTSYVYASNSKMRTANTASRFHARGKVRNGGCAAEAILFLFLLLAAAVTERS